MKTAKMYVPYGNHSANETDNTNPYPRIHMMLIKMLLRILILLPGWMISIEFKRAGYLQSAFICLANGLLHDFSIMAAIYVRTYLRILKGRACEREDIMKLVKECKTSIRLNKNVGIILSDLLNGPGVIESLDLDWFCRKLLEYRTKPEKKYITP